MPSCCQAIWEPLKGSQVEIVLQAKLMHHLPPTAHITYKILRALADHSESI